MVDLKLGRFHTLIVPVLPVAFPGLGRPHGPAAVAATDDALEHGRGAPPRLVGALAIILFQDGLHLTEGFGGKYQVTISKAQLAESNAGDPMIK